MNQFGSKLNCRSKIQCQKNTQKCGQDGRQDGGLKLELPITEPFMNRFGSNLIRRLIQKVSTNKN